MRVGFLLFGLLCMGGCQAYRLGPPAALPFDTLYVAPVENATYIAQAQAPVTEAIIQAFLQDTTVRIIQDESTADAVLTVVLSDYNRYVSATRDDDTQLARSFTLSLRALCRLVDRRTGAVYFDNREVTARTEGFFDSGFQPAEYENVAKLARELGRDIRGVVISVW